MRWICWLALAAAGCGSWWECPEHKLIISTDRSTVPQEHLEMAAEIWNAATGFQAVDVQAGGTVVVYELPDVQGYCGIGYTGCAEPRYSTRGISGCTIWMVPRKGRRYALIVAHELGHCMGLGHNYETTSIMHPGVGDEVWPMHVDHIRDCMQ